MSFSSDETPRYWTSLEDLQQSREAAPLLWAHAEREFGLQADQLEVGPASASDRSDFSRRQFMTLMGASAAAAGVGLSACVRKPVEKILPYAKRPEDHIPGAYVYYATAFQAGGTVQGVLAKSHDGRPTKLEGNPEHPGSRGGAGVWAQASVLGLYDVYRSSEPYVDGNPATWEQAYAAFDQLIAAGGVGVVVDHVMSPTYRQQLEALRAKGAKLFELDHASAPAARAGAELVGGPGARAVAKLDQAQVIASFDSDFLGNEPDHVRLGKAFSAGRKVEKPGDTINRLYSAEPYMTVTGGMADHRVRVKGGQVGGLLAAVAKAVFAGGVRPPAGAEGAVAALKAPTFDEKTSKWIGALAKDLQANAGKSVVMVGYRQPAWVHALAHLLNAALGANGKTVEWRKRDAFEAGSMADFKAALGGLSTVVCMGTNPAYMAAGDLALADALKGKQLVHCGLHRDETGLLAKVHLPTSHYLEAWGDLESDEGTTAIVQPLVAPLLGTPSLLELAARAATGKPLAGYDLVRAFWKGKGGFSERAWRRWLHSGVVDTRAASAVPTLAWDKASSAIAAGKVGGEGMELGLILDSKVCDGRYATNGWLQECPDPMTKLTWDNAACVSPATAKKLGVETGDMLTVNGLEIPAWVAPGAADDTVTIALGYGRAPELGPVSESAGFNAYPLMKEASPWYQPAQVSKGSGDYLLCSTQDWGRLRKNANWKRRPFIRENTPEGYAAKPDFVEELHKYEVMPLDKTVSVFDEPAFTAPQQWAMHIDLNTCTGCNACLVACVAENNIPVVGKDRVAVGREMHWIRLDRYYTGDENDPQAVVQPMPCQQCENAPCETVCPVAATTHSPEGLNDMAYNRCIGTRYCSNNCPFKVRRFNFFQYNGDIHPLEQMQKNPNVTIRFRGVIEKCTYCVQRINEAKIEAKVGGNGIVPDGAIVTACQQTCPTDSIVFGDKQNPESAVSKARTEARSYVLLRELNVQPRTTYGAKLRNLNPDLV